MQKRSTLNAIYSMEIARVPDAGRLFVEMAVEENQYVGLLLKLRF